MTIKIGSQAPAYFEDPGESGAREVLATLANKGIKHLVEIEIGGDGKIIATDQHPFWLPDQNRWVDAKDLRVGSVLQTSGGTWTRVTAIKKRIAIERVHNLTVDDIHTYYVMAGNAPVLVHNSNCSSNAKILGDNLVADGVVRPADTAAHHIVASTSPKAASARQQLANFGIDINDASNGVFLPRGSASANPTGASVHSRIHTNEYYSYVNDMVGGARNASEARDVLGHLRNQLQGGYWP